ncbi:zinc-binding dehydrogenase [Streptomyces acidicola]|uniref:zinc-binding dehydrogenase n=1 Tax=Streptomyces acidicola TaxID=2596892 RepID=UPI00382EF629
MPPRPDRRPPRLRPLRQQRLQHRPLLVREISPTHEPRSFTAQDPLSIHGLGADEVIPGPEHASALVDAVVDCVGGPQLVQAFEKLAPHGTLVAVDDVTLQPVQFPPGAFLGNDGRHGRSIVTFHLQDGPLPGPDLTWLADRVAAADLTPQISWRGSWNQIDEAITALMGRRLHGKAVLDITP